MIKELEDQNVIAVCSPEQGEYINTVFLREKGNSTPENPRYRMILNMKDLNKDFVTYTRHKMHSLQTCLDLMEPNCFMASIDLKDAFHTIPMDVQDSKYLKFYIGNTLYKYQVLPMGFKDSPRIFCKILKPVLAHLRRKGHSSSVFIDDFFLMGTQQTYCSSNIQTSLPLLKSLGFDISDKSCLEPTQILHHLGFILNSITMTVCLSSEKKHKIRTLLLEVTSSNFIKVRLLAKVIGTLVACFPGVEYGKLFYRNLEITKIKALKPNRNFNRIIFLPAECFHEIKWWCSEGLDSFKAISHGNPDLIIQTDASGTGWGALIVNTKEATQGRWSENEQNLHINVLELKAVLLGITALCNNFTKCHIQIQIDNMTAVTYINNMGGTHSLMCNEVAKEIIMWAKDKQIWISACHIAGDSNGAADDLSRKFNDNIEWMLNKALFEKVCLRFGCPDIDLFASRINHQLPKYCSLFPDSNAVAIDAFAHKWDLFVYAFPPFNLIPRVLRKLREDNTRKAIIIVPKWNVSPWWPSLHRMLLSPPLHLPQMTNNILLPHKIRAKHPLQPLKLMACHLSGTGFSGQGFTPKQ